MNLARLHELETARDLTADHLAVLRELLQQSLEGEVPPRNMLDLQECIRCVATAGAALEIINERIARLHCDKRPCDRASGICPKCEGSPV